VRHLQYHAARNLVQVARPDNHRWVEDHAVQPALDGPVHFRFGQEFAVPVGSQTRVPVEAHGLIHRAQVIAVAYRRRAAGVDHPLDPARFRRAQDVARPVHVDRVDALRVVAPVVGHRRDVEHPVHTLHGRQQRVVVGHVADGVLAGEIGDQIEAAGRPAQDAHLVAVRDQRPRYMRPDEPRAPGNQCGDHWLTLLERAAASGRRSPRSDVWLRV